MQMKTLVNKLKLIVNEIIISNEKKNNEKNAKKQKFSVRDRINFLIDPGSPFLEFSQLAGYKMYNNEVVPAGGIITGIGQIKG